MARQTLTDRPLAGALTRLRDRLPDEGSVVGLEPSCVAVLRDELRNLFPHDQNAERLCRQTMVLSEFLERHAPDWRVPKLKGRRAVVHGHCHHRAIMGFDAEERLLEQLGLVVEVPEPGCCGMAGSFGFEADHYDVAMQVGERVLLPVVRATDDDALIIADGFSYREQIQGTGRRALHIAEVAAMALRDGQPATTDLPTEKAT